MRVSHSPIVFLERGMPPVGMLEIEHKQSSLLSAEENQQVLKFMGPKCESLATTVIQLFETQPPHHSQWMKRDTGVLCFVKDGQRKNYFFRMYCLRQSKMVWEQEMYHDMQYFASTPFLHMFEAHENVVCFNFASDEEARDMKVIVDRKMLAKQKRVKKAQANTNHLTDVQPKNNNNNNNPQAVLKYTDPEVKKAKRKRNITKADIGKPSQFRHISHVGWDPHKGFDVNSQDADLNSFFQKAGVSESQLKDTETRKFIYDFIAANGGREAVIDQEKQRKPPPSIPTATPVTGPPVPPRGAPRSTHNRAAPPPPPTINQPPPRPPPTTPRIIPYNNNNNNVSIPPPPPGNAPLPPPPPPPMPPMEPPPCPTPTGPSSLPEEVNSVPDVRSALMESIRGGTILKPVETTVVEKKPDDARGDLLSEIRKGFQLKPANEREVKPISPSEQQNNSGNDLAAALSRALAERNRVIHPDDDEDTGDSDSNDDDWDA